MFKRNAKKIRKLVPAVCAITLLLVISTILGKFLLFGTPFSVTRKSVDTSSHLNTKHTLASQLNKQLWDSNLSKLGPRSTYRELVHQLEPLDYATRHTGMHMFGQYLYEKFGMDGLSICDSSSSSGCYHGFLGAAIQQEGLAVVSELDSACSKIRGPKDTTCPHGIGHGVLGYLGHDNIAQALSLCRQLTWKGTFAGCQSGVYMEYNFRITDEHTAEHVNIRLLDERGPYFPCDSLARQFWPGCYFEQPQWWESLYHKDYTKIGTLCQNIPDKESQKTCYYGLGQMMAISVNLDLDTAISACAQMPNMDATVHCRAGASWSFFSEPKLSSKTLELCRGLTQKLKSQCEAEVKIFAFQS